MIHKLLKYLIGIIIVGGAILIYYHFLDGTLIDPVANELSGRTYLTVNSSYTVGDDVVVYGSDFCKYRGVDTTVYWFLEDDVQIPYPPKQSKFSTGCYKDYKIEIGVLPGFVGNHTYKFVGRVIYHLPGRDVSVNLTTNDFYVNSK